MGQEICDLQIQQHGSHGIGTKILGPRIKSFEQKILGVGIVNWLYDYNLGLQCKDARHEEEDLPFTGAVSSLMDLRNWENGSLKQKENEEYETFVGKLKNLKESVREKCDKGDAFWEDMGAE